MRNPLFRAGLYAINPFDLGRKALNLFDITQTVTNPNVEEIIDETVEGLTQ